MRLQASFAGLQVLYGDVEEAICSHALYYAVWKKWDALPERFNWQRKQPDVPFYPLRPEFAESTYLLYQVKPFIYSCSVSLLIDSLKNGSVIGNEKSFLPPCWRGYIRKFK